MNGFRLPSYLEVELAGFGKGFFVRQNGRKVVKVDRSLTG